MFALSTLEEKFIYLFLFFIQMSIYLLLSFIIKLNIYLYTILCILIDDLIPVTYRRRHAWLVCLWVFYVASIKIWYQRMVFFLLQWRNHLCYTLPSLVNYAQFISDIYNLCFCQAQIYYCRFLVLVYDYKFRHFLEEC